MARDLATYAIEKEVEAGRGSPHGGVYLSFQHCSAEELRRAFGPVIDRLAKNGIDLSKTDIEVAPIAHYHMGGIRADEHMQTGVAGLFAAGEAVGGANGANRLSGNAITEAFTFGRRAGRTAAAYAQQMKAQPFAATAAREALALVSAGANGAAVNTAALIQDLQATMAADVGPFRTDAKLSHALARFDEIGQAMGDAPAGDNLAFDPRRLDWFDLRNMLLVARCVTEAALARTESRGAHQREDFTRGLPDWQANQEIVWRDGRLHLARRPVASAEPAAAAQ